MQVGMDSNMAFFFFSSSSSLCFEKGYEMLGTCFVVGLYVTLGSLTLMRDFCEATKRNVDACIANHRQQTDVKYILNHFIF